MAQSFDFIINRRAGTVMKDGEGNVASNLRQAFRENAGRMHMVEGGEIASTVRTWLETADTVQQSLMIGGGDGTLLTAAAEALNTDVALGLLPLGTQNFLSRDMGFSSDYREAARQYADSSIRSVDVGMVNGHPFLKGLLFDDQCVRFFEAREDIREQRPVEALKKIFDTASGLLLHPPMSVHVDAPGQQGYPRIVAGRVFGVTTNALAPRSNERMPLFTPAFDLVGNTFATARESQGELALYAFRAGMRSIEILPAMWNGTWDQHPAVKNQKATHFTLMPARAEQGQTVSIILDGEIKQTQLPLDVKILPGALRLYQRTP
jgi:diacylglycerol kinase family enzyme